MDLFAAPITTLMLLGVTCSVNRVTPVMLLTRPFPVGVLVKLVCVKSAFFTNFIIIVSGGVSLSLNTVLNEDHDD